MKPGSLQPAGFSGSGTVAEPGADAGVAAGAFADGAAAVGRTGLKWLGVVGWPICPILSLAFSPPRRWYIAGRGNVASRTAPIARAANGRRGQKRGRPSAPTARLARSTAPPGGASIRSFGLSRSQVPKPPERGTPRLRGRQRPKALRPPPPTWPGSSSKPGRHGSARYGSSPRR